MHVCTLNQYLFYTQLSASDFKPRPKNVSLLYFVWPACVYGNFVMTISRSPPRSDTFGFFSRKLKTTVLKPQYIGSNITPNHTHILYIKHVHVPSCVSLSSRLVNIKYNSNTTTPPYKHTLLYLGICIRLLPIMQNFDTDYTEYLCFLVDVKQKISHIVKTWKMRHM
jgi:hypothetical protein